MRKALRGPGKIRRKGSAARKRPRPRAGLQAFVGMFASGTGDLAARHDDYLYGWKKPGP